jgi:hypothetical protein
MGRKDPTQNNRCLAELLTTAQKTTVSLRHFGDDGNYGNQE